MVTAIFVWRYLKETEELRRAAQRQLGPADEQSEAQIRPAIVVRCRPPQGVTLVNVGSGPAFDLIASPAERGSQGSRRWSEVERFDGFVVDSSFIEVRGERDTNIRLHPGDGPGGAPILNGRSLQCEYRSLSGRLHRTVVDFDHATGMTVISTRFSYEPRAGA